MKICTKCKAEKTKTEFSKNKSKKDGLQSYCKSCWLDYRVENLESIKENSREYYKENYESIRAKQKIYNSVNADSISAQHREYRIENAGRISEYFRKHRAENPSRISANNRNRRAIKRSAEGKHSASDIRTILKNQRGLCANCETKLFRSGKKKYHVDHIMPLALGGSNWPANLQCLCPRCNLRKNDKDPFAWAKENGRLL